MERGEVGWCQDSRQPRERRSGWALATNPLDQREERHFVGGMRNERARSHGGRGGRDREERWLRRPNKIDRRQLMGERNEATHGLMEDLGLQTDAGLLGRAKGP